MATVFAGKRPSYDVARSLIARKAAAAKARDLAVALFAEAEEKAGRSLDIPAVWRRMAKSSSLDANDARFAARAEELLVNRPKPGDAEDAVEAASPRVREALEVARQALPLISDRVVMRLRRAASAVNSDGSEGTVLFGVEPGYVYKLFTKAGIHLADVERSEGVAQLHLLDSGSVLDTLTKIDRQSRMPDGLPVDVLGITSSKTLVVKMPEMAREATVEEARAFFKKHSLWVSENDSVSKWLFDPKVGKNQPVIRDEAGNSYAGADFRADGDTLPNLMADKDGNVLMTDVLLRPIDNDDVARSPGLAHFAPEDESAIKYSPDAEDTGLVEKVQTGLPGKKQLSSDVPTFYSQVERVIEEKMPNAAAMAPSATVTAEPAPPS